MDYLHASFMCRCKAENAYELDAQYEEALAFLQTSPKHFVTDAIVRLNWNYQITITGLPNDMWSAVDAERTWGPGPHGSIRVQCDLIEDGLAHLVLWARDTLESAEEV